MTVLFLIIGAYLLGTILTAAWVGKLFGRNIRIEGSGNPGARNAGRVLGKGAFVLVFLGDALKGAIPVAIARWLEMGTTVELVVLLSAMIGHILPVSYRFRGGQGISTYIGGLLLFHPLLFAGFAAVFLLLYPFIRSFTLAGFGAIIATPFLACLFPFDHLVPLLLSAISVLLIFAHLKDLMFRFAGRTGKNK
ncbi:glycerol-3-phosphate acyltransferase [Sporosarcina sp. Te-1]|uniref:glycerol-3-phosphate acyltransferase n=1 Tax=Sporosarcina sp. Te-1 TaxID=2818390 RepID=UPI001A9D228F|nr:glycerol-3-phosphate acyltransferase [Sporosarcina sp. Te-1]QTD39965.1 glycerol-3-phosphate acyltransferase [Sporosarcina sp. Te-1]